MRIPVKQIAFLVALVMVAVAGAQAQRSPVKVVTHAVVGEIKKVDRETGKIILKTAEGVEETVAFTGKTTVHGLKEGGKVAALTGKEGSHVVVHYVGEGAEKTAVGVEYIGKEAPKVMEGTVVGTGKLARTIVVKTPEGAEETLHLTERATIDSGKGVMKGTEYVAKKGERVTVHYTEAGGHKAVHLLKRLGKAVY